MAQRLPTLAEIYADRKKWNKAALNKVGYKHAQGVGWFHPDLHSKLEVYREGFARNTGSLKAYYGKQLVDMLINYPGSRQPFDWHPWAKEMWQAFCTYEYCGCGGAASTGKSCVAGLYALLTWFCRPYNTLCFVASTDKDTARSRIWKSIKDDYWPTLCEGCARIGQGMPGEMVISQDAIFTKIGNEPRIESAGIKLVAGDKKHGSDTAARMIGIKAPRYKTHSGKWLEAQMVLVLDEMHLLTPSMWDATMNLSKNYSFQCIGLANPSTFYDPFGVMNEPLDGWLSVKDKMESLDGWKTKQGYFLRLDGEKSPNVLAGRTIYPYLFKQKDLDDALLRYGTLNSPGHWQFNRAVFRDARTELAIYTEADIAFYGVDSQESFKWAGKVTPIAAWDPSFGGSDRSMVRHGWIGDAYVGEMQILKCVLMGKAQPISVDMKLPETHTTQACTAFMNFCKEHKIENPSQTIMDVTGGGGAYYDRLSEIWGGGCLPANFGVEATAIPVSGSNPKPANEEFGDKMTEIWCVPPQLFRSGQVRGIDLETSKELTARQFDGQDKKGRVKVESKETLRKRTGKSPDLAEATLLILQLGRERYGLMAGTKVAPKPKAAQKQLQIKKISIRAEAPQRLRSLPQIRRMPR